MVILVVRYDFLLSHLNVQLLLRQTNPSFRYLEFCGHFSSTGRQALELILDLSERCRDENLPLSAVIPVVRDSAFTYPTFNNPFNRPLNKPFLYEVIYGADFIIFMGSVKIDDSARAFLVKLRWNGYFYRP